MTFDDDSLAAELAEQAGTLLLGLRANGGDPGELRKTGDRLSHEFLAAELAARGPGDAVLSEEGRDDRARLAADRVWIVDPLDGTREFGEAGRSDWAVHVALWQRGGGREARGRGQAERGGGREARGRGQAERGALTAGAVALPAQGQVLSTATPPKVPTANGGPGIGGHLRIVVSRTRPPAFLERLREETGVTLVPMGSAGAKAAAVMLGEADAYIHAGGQYEWDSAAPAAVALAAGLHASRLDGSALRYNQPDPVLPDILICPVVLAESLLEAIGAAGAHRPQ
jgi:3'(2'), 5'-bisphosphate nucleotidase